MYLATSPKSNSTYKAIDDAIAKVKEYQAAKVIYLKNRVDANIALKKVYALLTLNFKKLGS